MTLGDMRANTQLMADLSDESFRFLESVAAGVAFSAGTVIFEEDSPAEHFYLITDGRVALEVPPRTRPPVLVETLGRGDLLGVSWLFPQFRWNWRARALADTIAVSFDAVAVRNRCDVDTALALNVHRAVASEAVRRLHQTRLRLLDLYQDAGS